MFVLVVLIRIGIRALTQAAWRSESGIRLKAARKQNGNRNVEGEGDLRVFRLHVSCITYHVSYCAHGQCLVARAKEERRGRSLYFDWQHG